SVPVRVGSESFTGLHMMQLWVRTPRGPYEALVVYPPDGYWRARPLPPAHMAEAAYGSSFLLGPVETEGRPLVKFKEIVFEPATRSFALSFADGSSGRLRVAELDAERMVLDATLDGAVAGRPFAALRSMYITQFNADVAQVAWKAEGAKGWQESGIMAFPGGAVLELWAGRLTPSRHNSSAPDMVFGPFSGWSAAPNFSLPKLWGCLAEQLLKPNLNSGPSLRAAVVRRSPGQRGAPHDRSAADLSGPGRGRPNGRPPARVLTWRTAGWRYHGPCPPRR
ncbi:MAG: hypothetical protein B7Z45_10550, partial [Azorhizobium sp. 12-66-6]